MPVAVKHRAFPRTNNLLNDDIISVFKHNFFARKRVHDRALLYGISTRFGSLYTFRGKMITVCSDTPNLSFPYLRIRSR